MERYDFSEYRFMWLFAMFDLPMTTKEERSRYTRFRNFLLKEGFRKFQFSVYGRFCGSEERSETFRKRLRGKGPSWRRECRFRDGARIEID